MKNLPPIETIKVIAPNMNRRLSGVTATIVRLLPIQKDTIGIASFGVGLPDFIPKLSIGQLLTLAFKPLDDGAPRVWHARRNLEMLLGLFLKHILRQNLKLAFTSASQRNHSAYSSFLIGRMDKVIATSKATKNYLKVPSSVIYHGINTLDFTPPKFRTAARKALDLPDLKLVGCFGRIRAQKGTDVFIDTMLELLPQHPDWGALILGRATQQHTRFLTEQKQKVADAGLSNRVIFAGEVPVEKINQWYQALDLFIAPQRWEGFGLTPLEAMACGVPVIATRVGAFRELIIENQTGHLIEPGDIDQMAGASKKIMSDDETRRKFGKAARKLMIDKFDIHVEAAALVDIYRDLART